MTSLAQAAQFLVQVIFSLYLLVLLLRAAMTFTHLNRMANPITMLVGTLTEPVLAPLRQVLPKTKPLELGLILLIAVVEIAKLILLSLITIGTLPGIVGLLVMAVADIGLQLVKLYFYAIIINVVLSWVQPYGGNPLQVLLDGLLAPILRPIRAVMPLVAGFDFSPLVALLLLQLTSMLLFNPLYLQGVRLAY